MAYYDHETGLPNHNLLLDRLNQVIAFNSRKQNNTAVIYISLAGFKAVVDARGHSGWCEVVCSISDRLTANFREYDTIARINRDEFVVVLGGSMQEGEVGNVLNKLQTVLSEPLKVGNHETILLACFGVVCFPADGVTSELLLQNAHIAMNQARKNGVTFQYYSEAFNQKAVDRLNIETGLLQAMDNGEFFLCYQPKMAINGYDIIGMEALVRWQRPGHGVVPPDMFIPVAEENGLIVRLGSFVLKEACQQNKLWQDSGLPKLKVAVNLSARQLCDNAFVPLVMQVLEESGLDPCFLELELTESALMGDDSNTVCKLLRLKELGISISVDDFGTGYSSLSYLKHLPIDTIKIDRSFVKDVVNDPDDAAIVDAILAMAHSLKLNVIAEGVDVRDAGEAIQSQEVDLRVDNICVTSRGNYYGVVDVNRFISAITDINLTLAKGANPLTGLPGNENIQREINKRLNSGEDFDIAYIDIDNFKPFNDHYGFQRGDVVIKAIGEIISGVARLSAPRYPCFCGHIGGDDFIIIAGPHQTEHISSQIIKALENHLPLFHGEQDFSAACYSALNRKGEPETFGLLSISIGIVNTRLTPVSSYAQLASLSTEVKKAAKRLPGSSVVINRRKNENTEAIKTSELHCAFL